MNPLEAAEPLLKQLAEHRRRALAREYAIARESRRYSAPSYWLDEYIRRLRLRWSAERRAGA